MYSMIHLCKQYIKCYSVSCTVLSTSHNLSHLIYTISHLHVVGSVIIPIFNKKLRAKRLIFLVTQLIDGDAGLRIRALNQYTLRKCSERTNTIVISRNENKNVTIGTLNFFILFIIFTDNIILLLKIQRYFYFGRKKNCEIIP